MNKTRLAVKSSKLDEMPSDEPTDSTMTISQLAKMLIGKLEETKAEISLKITEQISNMRSEIKTEMDLMKDELRHSVSNLKVSISQNTERIRQNVETLQRNNNNNDLLIRGIPFVLGEDLHSYFGKLCLALGYVEASMPLVDLRRLSRTAMVPGKLYIILVQFAITNQRNDFYGTYLKTRSLSVECIGFDTKDRIYINENLSSTARNINLRALKAKREGKLTTVFTKRGIVYVKIGAESESTPITSEAELQRILQ